MDALPRGIMLNIVRRIIVYLSFLALNVLCVLGVALAFDGCSKCYYSYTYESRWRLANSGLWVWVWPFAFLMTWIGIKGYFAHKKNEPLATLIAAAIFGLIFYLSLWAGLIEAALRCDDCLPEDPSAAVFQNLFNWGFWTGLIGLLVSYAKHKLPETNPHVNIK